MKNQKRQCLRNSIIQTCKESKDHHISSKLEQYIRGSGKADSEMVRENSHGQMELNTLENGKKIEHMERVDLYMWMEMCMMDHGLMIKLMVMEFTNM